MCSDVLGRALTCSDEHVMCSDVLGRALTFSDEHVMCSDVLGPKMFAGTKNLIPSVRFPSHCHYRTLPSVRPHLPYFTVRFPYRLGCLNSTGISRVLPYYTMMCYCGDEEISLYIDLV
jgi:hypothetical protein